MRFGSALHKCFDLNDKGENIDLGSMDFDNEYEMSMARAVFEQHLIRYTKEPLTPIASEEHFTLPLVNPETGHPTQTWVIEGIMDRLVALDDGRLALQEYKTTSRDFSPGSEYWQKVQMDQQLSIYLIAARSMGYDVSTILYDVTRRPALRPYKATPTENRKYKKDGTLYANQRDVDETPDEYYNRIVADIESRPEYYFARIEIARLDQDIEDCQAEVWQQQKTIRQAQKMGYWFRNPEACHGFSTCDFLPVCMNKDIEERTPDGFVRMEEVHQELAEIKGQE